MTQNEASGPVRGSAQQAANAPSFRYRESLLIIPGSQSMVRESDPQADAPKVIQNEPLRATAEIIATRTTPDRKPTNPFLMWQLSDFQARSERPAARSSERSSARRLTAPSGPESRLAEPLSAQGDTSVLTTTEPWRAA